MQGLEQKNFFCYTFGEYLPPHFSAYAGVRGKGKGGKTKMAQGKTNAVRLLDKAGVPYELHEYQVDAAHAPRGELGLEVAHKVGILPQMVFKTLVARGTGGHYVFVVPVAAQLDLKKAAAAVGEKRVELLPVAEIQKVTGYIRGGCSPLGMKKAYPTVFDISAQAQGTVCVSAGRPGLQVQAAPQALAGLCGAKFALLTQG